MTPPIPDAPFLDFLPSRRQSPQFWEAMIALGGTPEKIAPHLPEMSEAEVAAKLAETRGRVGPAPPRKCRAFSQRPNGIRSNWYAALRQSYPD